MGDGPTDNPKGWIVHLIPVGDLFGGVMHTNLDIHAFITLSYF